MQKKNQMFMQIRNTWKNMRMAYFARKLNIPVHFKVGTYTVCLAKHSNNGDLQNSELSAYINSRKPKANQPINI